MDVKAESERRAAADDSYPDPHPHLTTLTAPSTTSLMDMVSYGNSTFTTTSDQDIHPASHHHQATAHYYPHPHHPSDYATSDWQQTAVAAAAAAAAAAGGGTTGSPTTDPNSITTASPFYSFAPSDRPDLASVQLYHHHHHHHHSFPGGTVAHGGDLYSPSPSASLWHVPQSLTAAEDPSVNVQRYLPGMTSGKNSGATSGSSSSSASSSSSTSNTPASGKPKRRRVQSLPQRKAANIRERRRMFHLNTAFDELRKRLPAFNYEKRLSRIETLRLAMTYIGFMKEVSLGVDPRKVKLKPGMTSDAGSDLSHLDLESITSDDANHDDVES